MEGGGWAINMRDVVMVKEQADQLIVHTSFVYQSFSNCWICYVTSYKYGATDSRQQVLLNTGDSRLICPPLPIILLLSGDHVEICTRYECKW